MDGDEQPRAQQYDAFISYSHLADARLAPELQRLIRRVGRPWYSRSTLKVFRDQTDLEMSESLWGSIEAALSRSNTFVLVASPISARSPWVDREVRYWRDHRPRCKFYILLSDGEMVWDERGADFDWSRTTALPPSVSGWFDEEPSWLDVRSPPGHATRRGQRNDRLRDAARTVAAPLYGLRKAELDGVDEREYRRARRTLGGGVLALVVLAVLALVGAGIAYTQYQQKDQHLRLQIAENLGKQSSAIAGRDPALASKLALAAWQEAPSSGAARAALLQTYIATSSVTQFFPNVVHHQISGVRLANGGADALLFTDQTGATFVRSFRQSPQTWELPSSATHSQFAISPDGRYVVGIEYPGGRASLWSTELRTGPIVLPGNGTYSSASFSPDSTRVVLVRNDHALDILRVGTSGWAAGTADQLLRLPAPVDQLAISEAWLSDDGATITVQASDALGQAVVGRISTATGQLRNYLVDAAAVKYGQLAISCVAPPVDGKPATVTIRDMRSGGVLRSVALLKSNSCANQTPLRISADENHLLEGDAEESGFGAQSQQINSINLTTGVQYSYVFTGQHTSIFNRDGIGLGTDVWAEDQPGSSGSPGPESVLIGAGTTLYELGQIKQNLLAVRNETAGGQDGIAVPDPTGARVYIPGRGGGVFDATTGSLVRALPEDHVFIGIDNSSVDIADTSDPAHLVEYRYSFGAPSAAPAQYLLGPSMSPTQDVGNNQESWTVATTTDRVGGMFGGTVVVRHANDGSLVFPPWPIAVSDGDQKWFDASPVLKLRPRHPSQFATVLPDGTIGVDDGTTRSRVATLPTKVREPSNMGDAIAFDASGSRLADVSSDGTIEVWDVDTQRKVLTTAQAQPGSGIVGFTSDGYIATSYYSVSNNRTTGLDFWDLSTGLQSGAVVMDGSELLPATVSYTGDHLQMGNQEIMPVTIPATATAWAASLCHKKGLSFTDSDRQLLPSASGISQICA